MSLANTASAQLALPPLVDAPVAQTRLVTEGIAIKAFLAANPTDAYNTVKLTFFNRILDALAAGKAIQVAVSESYQFKNPAISDFSTQDAMTLPGGDQKILLEQTVALLQQ